jgi:hypothetical protein
MSSSKKSFTMKDLMAYEEIMQKIFPLSEEQLKERQKVIDETNAMKERLIDSMMKDYQTGEVPRIRSRDEIRKEIDDHMAKSFVGFVNVNDEDPKVSATNKAFVDIFLKPKEEPTAD